MHSHSSFVKNGFYSCLNIHHHQTLKTSSGKIIDSIALNGTTKFEDVIAGSVNTNGDCDGAYFTDGKLEYSNVVVMYSITLTIRNEMNSLYIDMLTKICETER